MQFSHEFHFIFSPFKILLISRLLDLCAAAAAREQSDGRTDLRYGCVCPPWQRRSMVDGTMEFISSVLKGTPIQPMYHNKTRQQSVQFRQSCTHKKCFQIAKFCFQSVLHTVFHFGNFALILSFFLSFFKFSIIGPGAICSGLEKKL